jgi:hypothetical protein
MRLSTAVLLLSVCPSFAQTAADLSGTWGFTHADDRFQGWIVLRQTGPILRGTWHTSKGKTEPDDQVTGRLDGNTVTLWRFIGDNRQSFVLTLSADGNRLDGFGDGYFLNHTNLDMQRSVASSVPAATAAVTAPKNRDATPALDVSGQWFFTHANDQFQGTVLLRQEGTEVTGTWHTSKGKTEPDDAVSGRMDGNRLVLWRFIGNAQQHFVLTLSANKSRLDGYGDGYFLNHTNLDMVRAASPAGPVTATPVPAK